jgi:hypothetical protein
MADTPDDLLAKARAGMGEWLDAEDRSDAEFEAAQRMYQGIYDLDRALSSCAPLPSAWARPPVIATVYATQAALAEKDATIARLTAELDEMRDIPVEYVTERVLEAAMAADPHRENGAILRTTDGQKRAWAWKAATREWEPVP